MFPEPPPAPISTKINPIYYVSVSQTDNHWGHLLDIHIQTHPSLTQTRLSTWLEIQNFSNLTGMQILENDDSLLVLGV